MRLLILIGKKIHMDWVSFFQGEICLENMMAGMIFQNQVSALKTLFSDRTLQMGFQSQS